MTKVTHLTTQALKAHQKAISVHAENINTADVPGVHAIDPKLSIKNNQSILLTEHRRENIQQTKLVYELTAEASASEIKNLYMKKLEYTLSGTNSNDDKLQTAITEFLSKGNTLIGNDDPSHQKIWIESASNVAQTTSNILTSITDDRQNVDKEITHTTATFNTKTKELFKINQAIQTDRNHSHKHYDRRDQLINELYQIRGDLNIIYNFSGTAYVTDSHGHTIAGTDTYAKLSHHTIADELVNKESFNPIKQETVNGAGKIISSTDVTKFSGGKIGGLLEMRDDILPNIHTDVQTFAKALQDTMNDVYSQNSTNPPKSRLQGNAQVSLSDEIPFEGKIKINALNKDGTQINGTSGAIRPFTIDLDHLQGTGIGEKVTTKDIMNEINQGMNKAPQLKRLSLGQILNKDSNQIENHYLLNNILLAGKSELQDGQFTFDMHLDGNNYFGSNVEILEVTAQDNGANVIPISDIPTESFKLEKGGNTRTNQAITISGVDQAQGPHTITVKIRVIGDNGVRQEGSADFSIDFAAPENATLLNQRFSGSNAAANPGEMQEPKNLGNRINTSGSIARTQLVDEYGLTIEDENKSGNFVLESSAGHGLTIESMGSKHTDTGKTFAHQFGLNHFFELEGDQMKLNPEITSGINNLARSKVSTAENAQDTVKVGDAQATGTMQFIEVPFATNFMAHNTITIQGVTLTFANAAPELTQDQIEVGANLNASLQNAIDKINAHSQLQSIVSAELAGGANTITITAKQPGTTGNNINIGTNNVNLHVNGEQQPNSNLLNGTDKDQETSVAAMQMGQNDMQGLQDLLNTFKEKMVSIDNPLYGLHESTLQGHAAGLMNGIAHLIADANNAAQINEQVLERAHQELITEVGVDQAYQYINVLEIQQHLNAISRAYQILLQTKQRILDHIHT